MNPFSLTKPYLSVHKHRIIAYIIIGTFVGLLAMLNPYLIGDFIDSLIEGGNMVAVFRFSALFAGLNIIRTTLNYFTMILYIKIQTKSAHQFTQETVAHVQKVSLSFVNDKDTSYLSQVINGDTNQLVIFCIKTMSDFVLNIINIAIPIIILLSLNAFVSGVMIAFLGAYVLIYIKFRKPLRERSMALRIAQNNFFAKLLEQLKLTRFIKVHVLSDFFRRRLDENFNDLLDNSLRMQRLSFAYHALDNAVTTIVQIILFLVGGWLILQGSFTIGMFTIFSMYFAMILGATKYFFGFGKTYQDSLVSCERLNEILRYPVETKGDKQLQGIERIEVKGLCFSYSSANGNGNGASSVLDSKPSLINELNLDFRKGHICAIAGHNGAGKSTLINLLMGMYIDEIEGGIYINGISIKELDMPALRKRHIGIAEQEPVILSESIEFNINLASTTDRFEGSSDTESIMEYPHNHFLNRHLEILNLKELVNKGHEGDRVSQSPNNFSGGEKQKLAILRVLLKDPDVMIFDEPTSAMDTASATKFMEHLHEAKHNKIIFVITHDEKFINHCDRVVVL